MSKKKVVIGLSGGVDSAVAAALLVEQGYKVAAVHLVCYREPGCRADQDRKDALKVALKLGIPFKVLDLRRQYRDRVLKYFFSEYQKGRTPNPDIVCNQEIKFGLFYDWALLRQPGYRLVPGQLADQGKLRFDYVATGHYCRNFQFSIFNFQINPKLQNQKKETKKIWGLGIPKDKEKDQTYFLYRLRQEQLEHLLFPLGDLTKKEVRQIAKEKKLPVAEKKDSTGICFIGELNVHNFLRSKLGEKEGDVLDSKGRVIGKHPGYWFFTIGQRGGWEKKSKIPPKARLASGGKYQKSKIINKGEINHDWPKLYVISKNKKKNQLVVGTRGEAKRKEFLVENIHWINSLAIEQDSNRTIKFFVRIRHRGKLIRCRIYDLRFKNKTARVKTGQPAFGIAPGQSAVFYGKLSAVSYQLSVRNNPNTKYKILDTKYVVLGGGVICK